MRLLTIAYTMYLFACITFISWFCENCFLVLKTISNWILNYKCLPPTHPHPPTKNPSENVLVLTMNASTSDHLHYSFILQHFIFVILLMHTKSIKTGVVLTTEIYIYIPVAIFHFANSKQYNKEFWNSIWIDRNKENV